MLTVSVLFSKYCPDLVAALDNPGGFWPKVADNSITSSDAVSLSRMYRSLGEVDSKVYRACLEILFLRAAGELTTPVEAVRVVQVLYPKEPYRNDYALQRPDHAYLAHDGTWTRDLTDGTAQQDITTRLWKVRKEATDFASAANLTVLN